MLSSSAYLVRSATPEEIRALGPSFRIRAPPCAGRRSFLRMRAGALCAHARTLKLSARLRAGVPVATASALPA